MMRGRRQDGIGELFLQADEFLTWRDGKAEFGKATQAHTVVFWQSRDWKDLSQVGKIIIFEG